MVKANSCNNTRNAVSRNWQTIPRGWNSSCTIYKRINVPTFYFYFAELEISVAHLSK